MAIRQLLYPSGVPVPIAQHGNTPRALQGCSPCVLCTLAPQLLEYHTTFHALTPACSSTPARPPNAAMSCHALSSSTLTAGHHPTCTPNGQRNVHPDAVPVHHCSLGTLRMPSGVTPYLAVAGGRKGDLNRCACRSLSGPQCRMTRVLAACPQLSPVRHEGRGPKEVAGRRGCGTSHRPQGISCRNAEPRQLSKGRHRRLLLQRQVHAGAHGT